MEGKPAESILLHARLHWAMIAIPTLLTAALLVITIVPILLLAQVFANLATLLSPSVRVPTWFYWIILPEVAIFFTTLFLTTAAFITSEITLTTTRLRFRTGLLSKHQGDIPLASIESLYISEPLLGRILGYGSIVLTTTGGQTFHLDSIRSPAIFHTPLDRAVNEVKMPKLQHKQAPTQDDSRYMPKA